jgi:hypothetical protein
VHVTVRIQAVGDNLSDFIQDLRGQTVADDRCFGLRNPNRPRPNTCKGQPAILDCIAIPGQGGGNASQRVITVPARNLEKRRSHLLMCGEPDFNK